MTAGMALAPLERPATEVRWNLVDREDAATMSNTMLKGRVLIGVLSALGLGFSGCSDALDVTGLPGTGDPIQLSREMTLGELQDALSSGIARVAIEIIGDGPVARRVVVGRPEATADEEWMASRVAGIETLEGQGTASLTLGDLTLSFDAETRFSAPGSDALSFAQFVERVEAALAEGFEPPVIAQRAPADLPQDPDMAGFHASALRLLQAPEGPALALNVDGDNLQLNPGRRDGEPDAWINVMGLSLELRVSDGVTELVTEQTGVSDVVEFEGLVESVNLEASTFTFTDGTVVRIVGETRIFATDADIQLTSLEAVQAALEDGLDVVAWGAGELESAEPRTIVALEMRFAVRDSGGGGRDLVTFEGLVSSVTLPGRSFTLTNGTVVKVTDQTEFILSGDGETLTSLEAVLGALNAGWDVIAYGAAAVESAEPLTLVAVEMRFVLASGGGNAASFEGFVESATLDGFGSFTLGDGTVVRLTGDTQIATADQGESLMSLAAVSEALAAGQSVIAWGVGKVEGTEPLTLTAIEVRFVIAK
jgi:DNA/RNA endonuclease YhcR with UshA esterase domain